MHGNRSGRAVMSHAHKADKLLIKPAAGARPAPPCKPDSSLPRHANTANTLTRHNPHDDTNPGHRPRQTDPPSLTDALTTDGGAGTQRCLTLWPVSLCLRYPLSETSWLAWASVRG